MFAADGQHRRVRLNDVGHAFEADHYLFRNLTVDLLPGRTYALTGPSGSGKSTLLGMLAGWTTPTAGTIVRAPGLKTSWVFQNPHGVASRTALDHVVFPLVSAGMTRRNAEPVAQEYLESFGLSDVARRRFSELSGGEAQRLMLARGIASSPALLLVDEPTAQLDQTMAKVVNTHLEGLRAESTVIVIATHDERTVSSCTDIIDLRELQR